ncbi:MAG: hypothetical protein NT118_03415, partial [Lentisphaerae bacterium]|nr:hypothetical protein [Lentisphaerota bacterium]
DRMILLNRAMLCEGSPEKVLSSPEIETIFGINYSAAKSEIKKLGGSAVERHECPECIRRLEIENRKNGDS